MDEIREDISWKEDYGGDGGREEGTDVCREVFEHPDLGIGESVVDMYIMHYLTYNLWRAHTISVVSFLTFWHYSYGLLKILVINLQWILMT